MYQEPCQRCEALEENLAFAQQRAADNGLRAQIGEDKITALVAEVRDLKARMAKAQTWLNRMECYCYGDDYLLSCWVCRADAALTEPIDKTE